MGKKIVVNLSTNRLALLREDQCIKEYPVVVGQSALFNPLGRYQIMGKLKLDRTENRERDFGSRRMLLNTMQTCLHGSWNAPAEGEVSGGNIRMWNNDIEELFEEVELETPVILVGE